jgi:Na+/H+ antiporter
MHTLELVLVLLVCSVILTAIARRLGFPAPVLLALGGSALALVPNMPSFQLDPELALALFVAPILLDAAFDTSVRDLRRNWIPVTSLVLVAVGVTTVAVAWIVHLMVPSMPWGAAIALGAIVAPPDAAAASAVLRQLKLPHRILVILEGESLLNDASALLIYRLAIAATMTTFTASDIVPAFALGTIGSVLVGYIFARINFWVLSRVGDPLSAIVMQFVSTFGLWIIAEQIGVSPIITVVVAAMVMAQRAAGTTRALVRLPSYAVWDVVIFVLNVLAFVLIGMQLRPILETLDAGQRTAYLQIAGVVLLTVIVVRALWVIAYSAIARTKAKIFGRGKWPGGDVPNSRGSVLVSWCGMRGIVTLAAAYALPKNFPYRELIVLCSFAVVVGTLVLQGLTLGPLIKWLALKDDGPVETEVREARRRLAKVAIETLEGNDTREAHLLRKEFNALLDDADGFTGRSAHDELRARIVDAQRRALVEMLNAGEIGDDAFHQLEAQLDWAEVAARGAPDLRTGN